MSLNHKDQNDYNKGGMITFLLSIGVTFAMMIYVVAFGGIDLKEVAPPSQTQVPLAGGASSAKQIDLATVKDAWKPSDDLVGAGKQLFAQNCAMCHGAEGRGDGVAGASLNPKPRNLVEGKWKYGGGRLGIMKVLHDGSPGTSMQSYKASLTVNQRWALTHFINSITENKVADDDAQVAAKSSTLD